jgi:tRNA A-37 threonylcarbamoyl transferase component Bud32
MHSQDPYRKDPPSVGRIITDPDDIGLKWLREGAKSRELRVAYRPDLEVSKWFEIFNKWVPIFLLSFALMLFICAASGAERVFLPIARFFLVPLKPFLQSQGDAQSVRIIAFLQMLSWWVFATFGVFISYLTLREATKATHLVLTTKELKVTQVQRTSQGSDIYVEQSIKIIPWEHITYVQLHRKPGRRSHLDYELAFGIRKKKKAFKIRYGDIRTPFDRMQFIRALVNYLPAVCPEEISEVFMSRGERESFTELWLRELTASPKRDKLIPLSPGMTLQNDQYTILEKLGTGGQATVYLADSSKVSGSNSHVAVKEFVLPVFPDPRVRLAAAERFHVDAEMIASLKHPQIVRFLDLFIEDHRAYLVLERIEGMNLKQIIAGSGAINERRTIRLALQMCDILSFLHQLDPPVAHRDFTPDNLMLSRNGMIKLIDFSVAQQVVSNVTGSVVGKLTLRRNNSAASPHRSATSIRSAPRSRSWLRLKNLRPSQVRARKVSIRNLQISSLVPPLLMPRSGTRAPQI